MKKTAFFLLWTLLVSVSAFAQQTGNYSTDVQVVSVSSAKNTVTLRCSGLGDNKKEALVMAQKSALYTLLHVGVKGVNNGQPLWAIVDEDYDRRMFEEDRYATVVANCQDLGKYTKENGRVRAEVEATFYLQPLMKAAGVVGGQCRHRGAHESPFYHHRSVCEAGRESDGSAGGQLHEPCGCVECGDDV